MQQDNRCIGRTLKNKEIWGSLISKSGFGVRCTRKVKNKCFCGLHEKKQPYGIFNTVCLPPQILMDIEDDIYTVLKNNNLSPLQFLEGDLDIFEYINRHLKTLKSGVLLPHQEISIENFVIENMRKNFKYKSSKLCLEQISRKDFRKVYKSIVEKVLLEPSIMNHLVKSSLEELQLKKIKTMIEKEEKLENEEKLVKRPNMKITKKYQELQIWWNESHKIKITDYDTKKTDTFVVEKEKEGSRSFLFTPTKVVIGYCQYWKCPSVPNHFKNENGIIISPRGQYYLSHITLLPERKMFHYLSKSEYFEYKYISEYDILRNTHEVKFL